MLRLKGISLAITAVCATGVIAVAAPTQTQQPMKVRWLIAHEPADAFRRAAKTFAEELKRESKGQMELVVMMPKDVGATNGNVEPGRIFELLRDGKVELSQTVTTGIGNLDPKFYVFDLPFLFRDHAHATKVLDGKIGQGMLASLEKNKLHGLAFTYSGGFRVIPSTKVALRDAEAFKGMRVRTTPSPVAQETLRLLGAKPVAASIEEGQIALSKGEIDAAETTYIRVEQTIGTDSKYLNETFHSLFLTSIIASDSFFKSLSKENQEALRRAALTAAKIERQDSIDDGEKIRAAYEAKGVEIVRMSPKAEKAFVSKVKPVYRKFEPVFGAELVNDIVAEK